MQLLVLGDLGVDLRQSIGYLRVPLPLLPRTGHPRAADVRRGPGVIWLDNREDLLDIVVERP